MRASRFLIWLMAAAVCGIGVFALLVWQAVEVLDAGPADAARAFEEARAPFGDQPALLSRQPDGTLVRRDRQPPDAPAVVAHIRVLSYQSASRRLTRADVPFWFFKLKSPAAQFFVRDTGLDLSTLGLTAADLEREGPTLILDETGHAGYQWLVWSDERRRATGR